MALNEHACRMIAPHFRKCRALCLGVPIVLLDDEQCQTIFGVRPGPKVRAPTWSKEMYTPDPYGLAVQLGVELTCVDAIAHDGREVLADLNYPQKLGEFDLVIDAGTTEHCFNVGQALVTAAHAVRVGGRILHTNPVSMGNHAFYNFCPTLYWDFYKANGFRIEALEMRDRNGEGALVRFEYTARFPLDDNWAVYCVAKRLAVTPLHFPVQGKYL